MVEYTTLHHRLTFLFSHKTLRLAVGGALLTVAILAGVCGLMLESRRVAYDGAVRGRRKHCPQPGEQRSPYSGDVRSLLRAAMRGAAMPGLSLLSPETRQAVLFDGAVDAEGSGGIVVTDAAGQVSYRSRSVAEPDRDFATLDSFQAHRRDPLLGLVVSYPGAGSGRAAPAMLLSRRINKPDGSFAGVVAGSIKLEVFTRLFAAMNVGNSDGIGLFTLDGHLLVREPPLATYDEVNSKAALFRKMRESNPDDFNAGIIVPGPSLIDGIKRVIIFRRIGSLPLGISLAIPEDDIYAGWASRAALTAIGIALLTVLAGGLAWGLGRELVRRSRAERAALESADQVRLLTDNSGDMIVHLGWDGVRHYVSPASISVVGRPADELLGRSWLEVVHPDDHGLIQGSLLDLKLDGAFPTTIVRVRMPDESERHVEAQGRAVPDGTGAIIVVRDVTARIALEDRLRQSQRMEALGQLTAGVAHDFNNMLQAQLGCLEMLIDELPGLPGPRRLAQQALQLGERGARLTNQLLSFSRQQILSPEPIVLDEFLAGLTETLRRTMGPGIRVISTVHPATPSLFADRAHLESAVLNLSLNARDAMPHGGVIRIEAFGEGDRSDGEPDRVVLRVQDEGTGMDAATLERACEPFFTTKGLNGTGLGLASVLGFATQSGGALDISSQPGEGTTIQITMPRAVCEMSPTIVSQPHGSLGGRLLVVDDTPEVLFAVTATLESGGFEVVYVSSPGLALQAVAEDGPFDCLITDYAMPLMNGGDLVREVQILKPDLPALIITGWADIETLDRLGDSAEVLRKPFKRDALLQSVRQLISGATVLPKQMHLLGEV